MKMKNIDIEQLKRENIYQMPNDFFVEMQGNVFAKINEQSSQISETKKGKILPLFTKYSIAAAVVFVFGLMAFFNFNSSKNGEKITKIDEGKIVLSESAKDDDIFYENDNKNENLPKNIENSITEIHQISHKKSNKNQIKTLKNETQITPNTDDVLEMYSSSELAILTQQAKQDVYLDIFND